jgi:DNA-binding transcriptional ArsR family regulator
VESAGNALRGFKAELFKALSHPARIHILELLRGGEKTVSELQAGLGVESSFVSQQLALLRGKHVVEGRKAGTSVYYRVVDENVLQLLDIARAIFHTPLKDLQAIATEGAAAAGNGEGTAGR